MIAIIELRISVEVEAAGFASERICPEYLVRMQDVLAILADPRISRDTAVAADHEFHRQIALATGNRYFVDITEHLGVALIPSKRLNSTILDGTDRTEYDLQLQHENEAIYHSIASGDPFAAKAAMHFHLNAIGERLRHANLRSSA